MKKTSTRNDETAEALATYVATSELALMSAQRLREAWRRHLEGAADAPSDEWVAEVAAQRIASDLALGRARGEAGPSPRPEKVWEGSGTPGEPSRGRIKRRRRRENKFLASIGRRGQRYLRWVLMLALTGAMLVAGASAISLGMEVAGLLHLVEDPVQLPVGIQLALLLGGAIAAWGSKIVLKHVERALYGSKDVRPKGFPL